MIRFVTVLLIGHVLAGCGSEGTGGDASGSEGATASSGGAPECPSLGPPTGSCSAGDECDFSDAGCSYDSYCKDGTWATVGTCSAMDKCPREGLTAGSSCEDEGALCLYSGTKECVSDLQCTGGVWVASGC